MSLMGIDIGTTGCKASVFNEKGGLLVAAYREYDILRPREGWAELDSRAVWGKVCEVIAEAAAACPKGSIRAVCPSSMGEAVVPVAFGRQILGSSLLNFDERGAEYLPHLGSSLSAEKLFEINGNTLGNHYTLTKLMWMRDHAPDVYRKTDCFMHWGAFAGFMLGAEPYVDFSLANRTLLFDINREIWSEELAAWGGIDQQKLPRPVPTGSIVGQVSSAMAQELGLSDETAIVAGAHDQCANAVGCGVLEPGDAMIGMGTYICIVPVFGSRPSASRLMPLGLTTEHHARPGRYVCFIYNHGGSIVKWHRDTFAARDCIEARKADRDIYKELFSEVGDKPSNVFVLPHFAPTGPPEYVSNSSGAIFGLYLNTTRGEILRGILESTIYYLRECLDGLSDAGQPIQEFRAVGGGSQSDAWLQIVADITGHPVTRAAVPEAGALGGAILAGAATGVFSSLDEGARRMVRLDKTFTPSLENSVLYGHRYRKYRKIWPAVKSLIDDSE